MKFNKRINEDIIKDVNDGIIDTGPNAILGGVRNYDDDFLAAHATKSDDLIFEEILYYINYKKQRGDYISYDEKLQIDRYCNLLLKQLKVNQLYRQEKGISNIGGYNNIPQEFYDMVENKTPAFVKLYYKEPSFSGFNAIEIRVPEDKLDVYKSLKLEDKQSKIVGKSGSSNILYTIDIENAKLNQQKTDAANQQQSNNKSKNSWFKKGINQNQTVAASANTSVAVPNNIPGKNAPVPPTLNNKPGVPNIPSRPNIPGSPPPPPTTPAAKPKGIFDL